MARCGFALPSTLYSGSTHDSFFFTQTTCPPVKEYVGVTDSKYNVLITNLFIIQLYVENFFSVSKHMTISYLRFYEIYTF